MSPTGSKPNNGVDLTTIENQARASNPKNSAWVSANAGSGKTYVLTRRVVRLLLAGFDPSRILCLTFTKSAAAEMSNRVFDFLSDWAIMDEDKLSSSLLELTGSEPQPAQLREARRLFARALETPGGLKIQTIHAFCEALLHQFPLEANIAGHFEIMDDRTQFELIGEARRNVIIEASLNKDGSLGQSLTTLIRTASDTKIDEAINGFIKNRHPLKEWLGRSGGVEPAISAMKKQWGIPQDQDARSLIEEFMSELVLTPLEMIEIADVGDATGVKTNQTLAVNMRLLASAKSAQQRFELMEQAFLTKNGDLRKQRGLFTTKLSNQIPQLTERLMEELNNFEQLRQQLNLLKQLNASQALFTIADQIIHRFEKIKRARGLLDFDDLIIRSAELLGRSDASQWVQYKLDQGIDHVLVDEAQDTNPHQWRVITSLIEEFFSGKGAREAERTIFAVGDEKQSIYSFQGAEPTAFADQRDRLKKLAIRAGKTFEDINLRLSFRSVPDVLSAVDKVFSTHGNYSALSRDQQNTVHGTIRHNDPGMVDIWPIISKTDTIEPDNWELPVDQLTGDDPQILLANQIANQVQFWLQNKTLLEGKGRPISAGDILVLVRSRDRFASALTRELKQRDIPVAGSDRLRLTDHIAVLDLMALANVILMPKDDLSLAAVLKSPLFNFDEELLLELAQGRGTNSLYLALEKLALSNSLAKSAFKQFEKLRTRADKMRVYEFFALLLGADGGRQKILNRMGVEAEDVLDAFLAQTLTHEQSGLPGLQNFIDWLQSSAPEIKREFDFEDKTIKIMTVHAAKGLEAPIVFLVDKGAAPYHGRHDPALVEVEIDETGDNANSGFLWVPNKSSAAPAALDALEKNKLQSEAEYLRLLYVAMTRAEDRLIICGITGKHDANENCWHKVVTHALLDECEEHLNEDNEPQFHRWQKLKTQTEIQVAKDADDSIAAQVRLPEWIGEKVKPEPILPKPLTPSGAQAMIDAQNWAQSATSPLSRDNNSNPSFALQRGIAIHRLLQVLPDIGGADTDLSSASQMRRDAAKHYLQSSFPKWPDGDKEQIISQVFSVLEDTKFGTLFASGNSGAEISVSGTIEFGGLPQFISGQIDRLVVEDDQVIIIDYKTNRSPPAEIADVPAAYISQLALYQLLVGRIYPDRAVKSALLWCEVPQLMFIPQSMLDEQLSKII